MTSTTTSKPKLTWDRHNGQFVAKGRFAGADRDQQIAAIIGTFCCVWSKAKGMQQVKLAAVAEDFGEGDVTLFSVEK